MQRFDMMLNAYEKIGNFKFRDEQQMNRNLNLNLASTKYLLHAKVS